MKRATLILSIVAILLFIVGVVLAGSAAASCTTAADQAGCSASAAGGLGIGALLYGLGALCSAVAWILGIIKTATLKRWGWFVLVLLLSPLGSLIYGAAGPDQPAA